MPSTMAADLLRNLYYQLPARLQSAILVKRRSSIWLRAGIVFVHIPKAAGTSINHALYGRFMGHVHASDVECWASAKVKSLPSFAVTRNPWDRLVSAYRFARLGRGIGGKVQAGVLRPEQYRTAEFETFERFVRDWLAPRDVERLDGIFQPQWPFVCAPNGNLVVVDHLGRVEDLDPTLEFIRASTGASIELHRSNRSGESADYRGFYTPELADLVARIYRRDVELFSYAF